MAHSIEKFIQSMRVSDGSAARFDWIRAGKLQSGLWIVRSMGRALRAKNLRKLLFVARKVFVITCAKKFRVDAPTIENNFRIVVRKYFHPFANLRSPSCECIVLQRTARERTSGIVKFSMAAKTSLQREIFRELRGFRWTKIDVGLHILMSDYFRGGIHE